MRLKRISLALVVYTFVTCVDLSTPLAANACGRFNLACKAKEQARKARELAYRTHPYYIQALAATRVAKTKGLVKGNDCRDLVETGSWVGGGTALASGVGVPIAALVKTVGKEAGNLMCSDAGM